MFKTLITGKLKMILPLVAGAILGAAIVGAWLGLENRRLRRTQIAALEQQKARLEAWAQAQIKQARRNREAIANYEQQTTVIRTDSAQAQAQLRQIKANQTLDTEQRNQAIYAVLAARLGQLRERQAAARTPARPGTAAAPPGTD